MRSFFDWEVEQHNNFQHFIQFVVSNDEPDVLFWKGDAMGMFSVKGLCYVLENKGFDEAGWMVPQHIRKMVPAKVTTFMWQLQKNRVATKENLMARGISLPDAGSCGLCGQELESAAHLFMHCKMVWPSWCAIMQREGVCWVVPRTVNDMLLQWKVLRNVSDYVVWEMFPYALVWTI